MIKSVMKGALALALVGLAGVAQADGDAKKGKRVFNKCKACHVLDKEQNRVGPHLVGIIGRPVGAVEDFKYSDAMMAWGEGKTWDDATLAEYLGNPKKVVPGTKMAFAGLKKDDQIADLIAFIKSE
ncbi:cytochrome c family protein [Paralimibaculum aggregatum]|uniref:Cytochrome c family protein n=1 Tax=Paralimibaculum aggregatum TaxID=3036245 RepID=A0ABQ6LRM6_9RHOB|nr:cytochrome c family protein [Limibaculum sp. NKW23]GMG84383.1 cytochrome c family protein [Limibaculum sp. NKW23]